MTNDPFRSRWIYLIIGTIVTLTAAGIAYNIGLSHGAAGIAALQNAAPPPAGAYPYPYPYGWHRPWGFGFGFPFFGILLLLLLFRGACWGGPWRRHYRYDDRDRVRRDRLQTILVVDDEPRIAAIARDYLQHAGYAVLTAHSGEDALTLARDRRPDLVVLDLRLPRMGGLDVARALRRGSSVPIIMLTARVEESDRLLGLEIGADDYITKPFSPRELVARVKAVLRRATAAPPGDLRRIADLTLDLARMTAARGGTTIDLTTTEFQLLSTLASHPGRVFTRAQLLDAIRGDTADSFDRAIDAHVKNLRRKIEPDPRAPKYVITVYGVGYKAAED